MHILTLTLLALFLTTQNPSIRVEATPKIQLVHSGSRGGSVLIRVTIPHDERNRMTCVAVDSGSYYRSSCWDHDGSGALRKEFWYSGLEAGEYAVEGRLEWVEEEKGERKVSLSRDRFVVTSGAVMGPC